MNNYRIVYIVLYMLYQLAFINAIFGQTAQTCTDIQSLKSRECCPAAKDGSKCGETSQRGLCKDLPFKQANDLQNKTLTLLLDFRAFYDRACVCAGNYDGIDCSQCKYGYEGEKCEAKSDMRIRKNNRSLSDAETSSSDLKAVSQYVKKDTKLDQNYNEITDSCKELQKEYEALEKKNDKLNQEYEDLNQQYDKLEESFKELKDKNDQLEETNKKLKNRNQQYVTAIYALTPVSAILFLMFTIVCCCGICKSRIKGSYSTM